MRSCRPWARSCWPGRWARSFRPGRWARRASRAVGALVQAAGALVIALVQAGLEGALLQAAGELVQATGALQAVGALVQVVGALVQARLVGALLGKGRSRGTVMSRWLPIMTV